ncbi:oxidoreductase NAD-binding domain-containing protein 1-like [Elysia marginata]|uniref:Oxidoreductase NAD-binding domain-containing protein 1 n=1 Tax=Elysia marginata TaxID=1093978 RepID=A0AAV4F4X3_9GAST|nr:oxidoreductase NAD-binding domain-containing protein 1-like [Elysia marginata]
MSLPALMCVRCCKLYPKRSIRFLRSMSVSSGNDHLQRTVKKPRNEVIAKAVVSEIKNLSKTVKLLKLRVDDKNFSFKAGQWVDMFIPGVKTVGGFSMSSPPHLLTETGHLHLAVKFSTHPPALWVHTECEVGSQVRMRVGGDFHYPLEPGTQQGDLLLVAGGVGVNPLYSMLQHFVYSLGKEEGSCLKDRSAYMLYSAKDEDELIFKDELMSIADTVRNFNLSLYSSREKPTPSSLVSYGHIESSDVHRALSKLDITQTDVFLCGPLPFIEDMKAHCESVGVPENKMHFEQWW